MSATDLVGYLACPHYTVLSLVGAPVGPVDEDGGETDLDVVARRGLEHEAAYLARLKAEGRRVVEIAQVGRGTAELIAAEEATRAAMAGAADVVFQGTFFDRAGEGPAWRGHADFLRRVDGGPGYEPEDTKLARRVKPGALLQLCLYAAEIERLRGAAPREIHVVLGGQTRESFAVHEVAAYFRQARRRFVAALAGPVGETYPTPCDHCGVCRYAATCEARREADDHLSLVANLTREQGRKLEASGVATTAGLAALGDGKPVKGIGGEALVRLRRQARLQVAARGAPGVPPYELLPPVGERHGLEALPPPSPGDLFFDMEGDPYVGDGLEYLFGVAWREPDGSIGFRAFWGHTPAEEKAAFEGFLDFVAERRRAHPDLHIYHYAPYEPAALGKLMGRHATREDEVDDLLRRRVMVDLYRVVRQAIAVGSPSYSIKKLEPLYMPAREGAIVDAGSSIVEYERWLECGDARILEAIEAYNRDDCVSTVLLRDWLEARRPEVEAQAGRPLGRARPGSGEVSEKLEAADAETAALVAALTGGVDAEPDREDRDGHARWLLAQLLDYHRRDAKPEWWSYFRRVLDLTDAELVEDSEAIGELEYVGPVGTVKRSIVHRYRFPPQEHKLKKGGDAVDPVSERKKRSGEEAPPGPGTIHDLDPAACTIDLRREKGSEAPHPRSLVPGDPMDTTVQREAIAEFARDVIDRGIDAGGAGRAVRDLLLRRAPRIAGNVESAPLFDRSREPDLTAVASRLALGLEGGCLAIQGPPGSGKTYTAAHIILALVRAGKRVGITAQSHSVIGKVLQTVLEHAGQRPPRILQRAKADQAVVDRRISVAKKNAAVDDALAAREVDVVAGTAWLFARPELRGNLDVLLVDEAGQFSLANVVAIGGAAENLILVGDPRQLAQPGKGTHPPGADVSALEHFLDGAPTLDDRRGLFLDRTYRMHPSICAFVSELSYDGRLHAVEGRERQVVGSGGPVVGAGLRWVPVAHQGNRTSSSEEVAAVVRVVEALRGRDVTDCEGAVHTLGDDDILVVAPYNAHVNLLAEALPGIKVGTVDRFQGQEAPVVIVAMAASSAEDVPRGMEFLFSRNRLNVAVSRAKALSILVASPTLLAARCRTVEQMKLVNGLCRFVELAERVEL